MKFVRLLPLWVVGFSSLAQAEEPGVWGSKRPAPSSAPAASVAPLPKPGAVASGHYEQAPGTLNDAVRMVWKTAVGELADRAEHNELKKEDVLAQYAELDRTRAERRTARLKALRQEVGADLDRPEVQREYARHHRTVAFLERARLVTGSEAEGMRRAKSFMRIQTMLYRENNRHQAALQALRPSSAASPKASAP